MKKVKCDKIPIRCSDCQFYGDDVYDEHDERVEYCEKLNTYINLYAFKGRHKWCPYGMEVDERTLKLDILGLYENEMTIEEAINVYGLRVEKCSDNKYIVFQEMSKEDYELYKLD